MVTPTNPERDQDRVEDTTDTFKKYGYVLFPQQRRIYEQLAGLLRTRRVLEAGCGNGCGTALLERRCRRVTGTDKLAANLAFAAQLYPWITFLPWDLNRPWGGPPEEVVVAVECFEHVADPRRAMAHLLDAAIAEVWLSTPNGAGRDRATAPENPYHVQEYAPAEVLGFVRDADSLARVEVYRWDDLSGAVIPPGAADAAGTPLVYRIVR